MLEQYSKQLIEEEHRLKYKLRIKNFEMEKARVDLNLNQSDLAEKTGLSTALISQIECCYIYPTEYAQLKISQALNKTREFIFPIWLQSFSRKWRDADHEIIVPISQISLSAPETLFLESEYDREYTENNTDLSILKTQIKKSMSILTNKEKRLINYRYGLEDGINRNLEEVGKEFGVTRERIRQIEAIALEKLRNSKSFVNYKR
jgi:transcriptional regulator with XRE-family HTH domain